jgi:hypothetical protein
MQKKHLALLLERQFARFEQRAPVELEPTETGLAGLAVHLGGDVPEATVTTQRGEVVARGPPGLGLGRAGHRPRRALRPETGGRGGGAWGRRAARGLDAREVARRRARRRSLLDHDEALAAQAFEDVDGLFLLEPAHGAEITDRRRAVDARQQEHRTRVEGDPGQLRVRIAARPIVPRAQRSWRVHRRHPGIPLGPLQSADRSPIERKRSPHNLDAAAA